jgi:hypothetical protein
MTALSTGNHLSRAGHVGVPTTLEVVILVGTAQVQRSLLNPRP